MGHAMRSAITPDVRSTVESVARLRSATTRGYVLTGTTTHSATWRVTMLNAVSMTCPVPAKRRNW